MSHAMQFGQRLIFDFGFESEMRQRDIVNLMDQMTLVHNANKVSHYVGRSTKRMDLMTLVSHYVGRSTK